MNIIIKRTQSIKHFVEGHLYIDENLICDTLENSRSCLSSGIYAIRITKCKLKALVFIMNDIQLSENFKLSESTASESARRRKINNDAPESVIENLRNLCHHVVYYMKKN